MKNSKNSYLPFLLLFIQPVFMASNLIVARGGVEYVPPISLAFWRWAVVVLLLLPFTYSLLIKNSKIIKKEFKKLFFLGAMGCGVCGAFPFLAGETTTVTNMGIIYTSSPIFIIMISAIFFNEKINLTKIIGLVSCLIGVFAIIIKGDLNLLLNLNFTIGDLWMLAAAIGWALYSIYLFYWKSQLPIFQRFTLVAFFGAISLLPFYIIEEVVVQRTVFNSQFFLWVLFAAISPGIIAFTLYTQAQKSLGASLTGFTLYVFTIYAAIYGFIFFDEKINFVKIVGLVTCLIGVFAIIIKGDLNLLLNLNFTIGDLWMLAAAIGWALYSIYLFYWKSQLTIFQRFTLVAFFGAISLLPFYIIEEVVVQRTVFNSQFFLWVLFAAISPGIIAFTLYTQVQKSLGASLTGFTLYIFTIYAAIYGFIFFDEKLESFHYLGTVLVFIGIYLAKKNYETKT